MVNLTSVGVSLLFISIILIVLGSLFTATKGEKSSAKFAFGGFIGLIPFGWASDKQMFYLLITLMIFALVIFYLLRNYQ